MGQWFSKPSVSKPSVSKPKEVPKKKKITIKDLKTLPIDIIASYAHPDAIKNAHNITLLNEQFDDQCIVELSRDLLANPSKLTITGIANFAYLSLYSPYPYNEKAQSFLNFILNNVIY